MFYLKEFIKTSDLNLSITETDRESPDFGGLLDGQTIGVEVTHLMKKKRKRKGSEYKETESFLNDILKIAKDIFFSNNGYPINLKAIFAMSQKKSLRDKKKLASEIVSIVTQAQLPAKSHQKKIIPKDATDIAALYITSLPKGIEPRWVCVDNHIGWSSKITIDHLSEIIQEKENNLPKYFDAYVKNMLLIVADRTNESGMFHIDKAFKVKSGFNNIYMYLYPENWLKLK